MSLVSRTSELVAVESSFAGSSIPRAEVAGLALLARQVESLDTKWEEVDPLRLLPANVVVPGGSLHHTSVQCGPGFAAGDPAAAWDSSAVLLEVTSPAHPTVAEVASSSYRVFHNTGHLKIWLCPWPFINMNWTPEYFLSA